MGDRHGKKSNKAPENNKNNVGLALSPELANGISWRGARDVLGDREGVGVLTCRSGSVLMNFC